MGNELFTKLKNGLEEAIDYEKGNNKNITIHKISIAPITNYSGQKIKDIRLKLKLTQKIFAYVMGVSIKTVEAWESGKNIPNGTAQRMLEIFDKDETALEKYHILVAV